MNKEDIKEILTTYTLKFFNILFQYLRTIEISFLIALIITLGLMFHARSEMIKNFYADLQEQALIEERLAKQLVEQSDLIKGLQDKKYSICLQVGNLYYTAHDYKNAEIAYKFAVEKSKMGVFTAHFKLANALIAQEKFSEADNILSSIKDFKNANIIKQKTRTYINMGDKYYSIGKFLSAVKCYEKAKFYYDRFKKQDKAVTESIQKRIVNSYIQTADIMVKHGYCKEAVKFLKKAEKILPKNYTIKYKLAVVYSDIDPQKSVEYFEPLLKKIPQEIDYGVYCKALIKSANIAELEGNDILAKNYRYKIHSVDLLIQRKVIYRNDINVILDSFDVKKMFFKYKLTPRYRFENVSNSDITKLSALFVLKRGNKVVEKIEKNVVNNKRLSSNGGMSENIEVTFGKNIFTKHELMEYEIETYLFKDPKYKTLVSSIKIPKKTLKGIAADNIFE